MDVDDDDNNQASSCNNQPKTDDSCYRSCSVKKGILKTNRTSTPHDDQKAHFDEMNILATYHPPDKDYGHMKIQEPNTPYNRDYVEELDADVMADKLKDKMPKALKTEPKQKEEVHEKTVHEIEFEKKRRDHYNEGKMMARARELLKQEMEDEMDDE